MTSVPAVHAAHVALDGGGAPIAAKVRTLEEVRTPDEHYPTPTYCFVAILARVARRQDNIIAPQHQAAMANDQGEMAELADIPAGPYHVLRELTMELILAAECYTAQAKANIYELVLAAGCKAELELLTCIGHDLGQVQMHLRPVSEGYQPIPREMAGAARPSRSGVTPPPSLGTLINSMHNLYDGAVSGFNATLADLHNAEEHVRSMLARAELAEGNTKYFCGLHADANRQIKLMKRELMTSVGLNEGYKEEARVGLKRARQFEDEALHMRNMSVVYGKLNGDHYCIMAGHTGDFVIRAAASQEDDHEQSRTTATASQEDDHGQSRTTDGTMWHALHTVLSSQLERPSIRARRRCSNISMPPELWI